MRARPRNVSTQVWADICTLVVTVIVAYRPNNDRLTRRLTASAARFVLWAVTELRAPVVAKDLFQRNVINKYVRKRYAAGHSQTTVAAQLNHLALAAAGMHVGQPPRLGNPGVGRYTDQEQANIRAWSRSRPERVRHDTMALIGLVGGAGLRTSEAANLRPRDISSQRGHIVIDVIDGTRPRTVPLNRQWAPLLTPILQDRNFDGFTLLPSIQAPGARPSKVSGLCNIDADSPALAKLRDTWVIDHLARIPLGVLTHVAGFTSLSSLSTRYAQFTSAVDDAACAPFYDVMAGEQR